jgi:hypothetical protein
MARQARIGPDAERRGLAGLGSAGVERRARRGCARRDLRRRVMAGQAWEGWAASRGDRHGMAGSDGLGMDRFGRASLGRRELSRLFDLSGPKRSPASQPDHWDNDAQHIRPKHRKLDRLPRSESENCKDDRSDERDHEGESDGKDLRQRIERSKQSLLPCQASG